MAKRRSTDAGPASAPVEGTFGFATVAWPARSIDAAFEARARDALIPRNLEHWSGALPPVALVALEVLVDAGGGASETDLLEEVTARCGAPADLVRGALSLAASVPLCVRLTWQGPTDRAAWMLLDVNAEALSRTVLGVSLPDPPSPDVGPREREVDDAREELARLAVIGLLAHRSVKLGTYGTPHRGSLKALARAIGAKPERVVVWVEHAVRSGTVRARGGTAAPTLATLREAAAAARPERADALPPAFAQWAGAFGDRWVSLEALLRAWFRVLRASAPPLGDVWPYPPRDERARLIAAFGATQSLARHEHRGRRFVRTWGDSGERDLHVTPSFEVIAGPRTPRALIAPIALGCELKRVDAVLTFAITGRSVMTGAAAGVSADALLEALGAASRHPVPDNVAHSIRDWAARARIGALTEALAVRAPADALDAVQAQFPAHVVDRASRDLLLLDPAAPLEAIEKLLSAERVALGATMTARRAAERAMRASSRADELDEHPFATPHEDGPYVDEEDADDDLDEPFEANFARTAARRTAPKEPPLPLVALAKPSLRARLAADVASKFAESRKCLEVLEPPRRRADEGAREPVAASGPGSRRPPARLDPFDPRVMTARSLLLPAYADFEKWLSTLPAAARADWTPEALPLALPFLMLAPAGRRGAMARARSIDQLLRFALASRAAPASVEILDALVEDHVRSEHDLEPLLRALLQVDGAAVRAHGSAAASAAASPAKEAPARAASPSKSSGDVHRKPTAVRAWIASRKPGDRVWLELTTADGVVESEFVIDRVQARGGGVTLLVSSDDEPRGRVVHPEDILGASSL